MARPSPLVSQYLENISRDALRKYIDVVRAYVRNRQGIYALYRRRKLYYVGLAKDLRWRLHQHLRDHHGSSWDRFSVYLTIGDAHLKELESLILRVVRPSGNKQIGHFRKSENLRSRLKRDIKRLQQDELISIIGQQPPVEIPSKRPKQPTGRKPALAVYVTVPLRLRVTFKGRTYRAFVRRDGSIRFGKKLYNSPSTAGTAVCKRSCDGWYFWKYERAPGDWVFLNELRK
jgi:Restriction Enzyme Adenine Methylase Associated